MALTFDQETWWKVTAYSLHTTHTFCDSVKYLKSRIRSRREFMDMDFNSHLGLLWLSIPLEIWFKVTAYPYPHGSRWGSIRQIGLRMEFIVISEIQTDRFISTRYLQNGVLINWNIINKCVYIVQDSNNGYYKQWYRIKLAVSHMQNTCIYYYKCLYVINVHVCTRQTIQRFTT